MRKSPQSHIDLELSPDKVRRILHEAQVINSRFNKNSEATRETRHQTNLNKPAHKSPRTRN